jgi:hypothetical protein
VKNTITDRQAADLARRAQKAQTESMFSKRAVEQRKASEAQRRKAGQS